MEINQLCSAVPQPDNSHLARGISEQERSPVPVSRACFFISGHSPPLAFSACGPPEVRLWWEGGWQEGEPSHENKSAQVCLHGKKSPCLWSSIPPLGGCRCHHRGLCHLFGEHSERSHVSAACLLCCFPSNRNKNEKLAKQPKGFIFLYFSNARSWFLKPSLARHRPAARNALTRSSWPWAGGEQPGQAHGYPGKSGAGA